MSTLVDIVFEEHPGKRRQRLLSEIEREIKSKPYWGSDFCVLAIATNIYEHIVAPGTYLTINILGFIEEHLTKLYSEGCKGLLVLLSTYGGEITFPEAFMSKVKDMGFEKVHTFILDTAFSAGTVLALLSDRIIGFSNSHIGPVDPQLIATMSGVGVRIVSAMSIKRFIEQLLPELVMRQRLGKEDLVKLYAAQDLLLYEKALESINYIERVFDNGICKTVNKCHELKKLLLHEAMEHSQPISLRQLKRVIPEKVVIVDDDLQLQKLRELIISYRALVRYLFTFEGAPGAPPGTIKTFVIGSKYGEIVIQATPIAPAQVAQMPPPKQVQEQQERK